MSLAATLRAMKAAGCSVEQIVSVVEQVEAERLERVREGNRKRQATYRERHPARPESNGNNALHAVTERDERDAAPPSSVPLSSPPTPPPIIPLPSTPSTSLRSDTSARAALDFFERFWAVYPRKTEKKAAAAKFFALLKSGVNPEVLIAGAQRYAASKPEPKYTKQPLTWLNRGCWDDEQLPRDGPKREPAGSLMARVASGNYFEEKTREQSPGEYEIIQSPGGAKPRLFGFDREVSEPGGDDGGGTLLDLRSANARWR